MFEENKNYFSDLKRFMNRAEGKERGINPEKLSDCGGKNV